MTLPLIVEDASATRWLIFADHRIAQIVGSDARKGKAGLEALKPEMSLDYLIAHRELSPFLVLELVTCPECSGAGKVLSQAVLRVKLDEQHGSERWTIVQDETRELDELVLGESLGPAWIRCPSVDCLDDFTALQTRAAGPRIIGAFELAGEAQRQQERTQ